MEKDGLRKQILEELQSQFEGKLRDAKRQKTQAEEELESASEKWRAERRRLNAEIDRLEASLAESKDPSRRKTPTETKQAAIDPSELAKLQAAAEEKLHGAQTEWEAERTRLVAQVSRLERAVADAIERSSNPIRSTQPIKEQFEARLEEAEKKRTHLEQTYLRAKSEWDEERKKLSAELIKMRRLAPPSKALEAKEKLEQVRGRRETVEEARIRELEERLEEANTDIQKYHQLAAIAREETRNQFQPRLEEAYRERVRAEDQLAAGAQKWDRERQQLHDQLAMLQQTVVQAKKGTDTDTNGSQLQAELRELSRAKAAVEDELDRQSTAWSSERRRLNAEIEQLESANADALKAQQTSSRSDLREAEDKIASLEKELRDYSEQEGKTSSTARRWERERQELEDEVASLQRQLDQVGRKSEGTGDQPEILRLEAKLQESVRAKTSLESEFEREREKWLAERQRLTADIDKLGRAGSDAAKTARTSLDSELAEANKKVASLERQVRQVEAEAKSAETARSRRQTEVVQEAGFKLEQATKERTQAVEKLQAEKARWDADRKQLQGEIQQLQRTLAETKEQVSGEVVQQLRVQYDKKIQEMIQQKTQLTQELETASSMLKQERARFAEEVSKSKAAKGGPKVVDTKDIDAEVSRVESIIREITTLIDDPATELSTVIRKNVERAELDAYLKGILFSLGRGKSMA